MKPARDRGWRTLGSSSVLIGAALWVVALCGPLLRLFGVDRARVLAILEARLTLDFRGHPRTGSSNAAALGPVLMLLFFWLSGLAAGVLAVVGVQPFVWMLVGQCVYGFLFAAIVLLQYGQVLVDPTDLGVLTPRPVDDRTIFAARLLHIWVYALVLGGFHLFFPVVLGCVGFKSPMPLFAYPLCTALTTCLVVASIGLLFTLILRVFGPSWFQRITLWLQIGIAGALFGGMPLLQVLLPREWLRSGFDPDATWLLALPPVHHGGLFAALMGAGFQRYGVHIALSFALPLLAALLALRLASRHFAQGLQGRFGDGGRATETWPRGRYRRLGARLLETTEERSGYDFAFSLAGRDRLFVRLTWTQLAAIFVPLLGACATLVKFVDPELRAGVLAPTYLLSIAVLSAVETSRMTEDAEANWVFSLLPLQRRGAFVVGALTAIWWRTLVPVTALLVLIQLVVLGGTALGDVLLALGATALVTLRHLSIMTIWMPFSHRPAPGETNVANLPVLASTLVWAGAAAVAHGLLFFFAPLALRWVLGLALLPLVMREYRRARELEPVPVDT